MMNNTILSSGNELEEDVAHTSMRPESLKNFVGQTKIIRNLSIFVSAALTRNESMDHVLLYGPPGLGKTTLAHIIAKELKVNFRPTSGPLLRKAGDLAAILTNLQAKDILFIDEIHRLNRNIEEILYTAMEDFRLDIVVGEGCAARTIRVNLQPFTLIGATTRFGLLSNPLIDRFGIPLHLEFYTNDEVIDVLKKAAKIISININDEGAYEIALRSRGTPRIALRLLRRVRDFIEVEKNDIINKQTASDALEKLGIDRIGLNLLDLKYLKFLLNSGNNPVGIETISAALAENSGNIEDVIEPYLIKINFLQRTARGRVLTDQAIAYLKNFI